MHRDADIGARTSFGKRFLAAYERGGGSLAAFSPEFLQALKSAERGEHVELLCRSGVLGQRRAQADGLHRDMPPEELARRVLEEQKRAGKSNLFVTAISALLGLVLQVFR